MKGDSHEMKEIENVFNNFPKIETNRFLLREIGTEDIKEIFDIYSNSETLRYQNMEHMNELNEAEEYVNFISTGYQNKIFIRWGITEKGNNQVIGLIALHHIESGNRKVSIGYILNERFWKQGVMTETVGTVIDYLFNDFNINRIEAEIHPENIASIRLCEKLGFKKERLKEECILNNYKNEFEDRLIYGIIRRDYHEGKKLYNNLWH